MIHPAGSAQFALEWVKMKFSSGASSRRFRGPHLILILAGILIAGCHSQKLQPKPSIEISRVPPALPGGPERMNDIEGKVVGGRPGEQIVLYARNGIWWVQPFWIQPLTAIQSDGTWKASTHLGSDYAVLLVEPGYHAPAKIAQLPTEGNGVVAIAAFKGRAATQSDLSEIHFSGYDWIARSAPSDRGGEKNVYDPANVWTDEKGNLHLRMGERNGVWSCAEVSLVRSLGYGTYRFVVKDSAHLSESGVLGIFTLDERLSEDSRIEMDVELSQWGKPGSKNAQYVVQPYYIPENISRFEVPAGEATHVLRWETGVASFKTVRGSMAGTGAGTRSIAEHVFTSGIPAAAGETVHIDLYDFYHSKGKSRGPAEVVIEKFEYLP